MILAQAETLSTPTDDDARLARIRRLLNTPTVKVTVVPCEAVRASRVYFGSSDEGAAEPLFACVVGSDHLAMTHLEHWLSRTFPGIPLPRLELSFHDGALKVETFELRARARLLVTKDLMSITIALSHGETSIGTINADHAQGNGHWWIRRCFVTPLHRGQGLGSLLLRRLQTEAVTQRGFKALEVIPTGYDSDETRVRAFFTRCGFSTRHRAEDFYVWEPVRA